MCHYRLIILFALTFCSTAGAKAQESLHYFFRHIDQSDGLQHNDVLSFAQDGKGFIWVATRNGLQRYDGSRFIYYPEMLSNSAERLTSGAEIYADKKNNLLWITNNFSIEKMELGKNTFTVYSKEKLVKDPSFVFDSFPAVNDHVWMLGRNGAYHYDRTVKQNTYSNLSVLPASAHQATYMATDSTNNNTWMATGTQLFLFDKKRKTVWSDDSNPGLHPLLKVSSYDNKIKLLRFVMIDSRKNIWVTTWADSLYRYDDETKKISRYSLSAIKVKEGGRKENTARPLVNCILEDDHHVIWIGTEQAGLLRYNREKDNFDYCITQKNNNEGIRYDYRIFGLFQDQEQNIWIGTDKGISIFNPYRQYFTSIRHEEYNSLSIRKSEIISFIQTTNGDMFIGTWGGGMAVYDNRFNFKKKISFNGPYQKNLVWSFMQVDPETLWIGCQHGWLLVYNIVTGATKALRPPEMEGSTIRCMEKDNKGNIWFGLHNGKIIKWDKKQAKFFPYGAGLQDSFKNLPDVLSILIDRSQHCWVSTEAGFKQFDLETRKYINTWLPDTNSVTGISGITCQGIEEYNDSTLLIGTIYGGLNFFNKRTKIFTHLNTAGELSSNTIHAIKKDTAGYIWFTTDYGLYKFNPAEKKIIPYSMSRGIIHSSFLANKFYPLQDGQWLTFTTAEAVSFNPRKAEYQGNCRPRVAITGFKLFDKPVFIDSLLFENKPVRLSYKENFFTIEFAALNFSSLQQTNYYYRLEGIDKGWVNGRTRRFANYTDLHPGEYIFEVKAENGNNSGEITAFKIIIAPPFWKTWWFISMISFCLLLLVYLFIKLRENNIKEIEAEKLKVQQLNAEQYKSKLELEQIINYFSSSLIDKNTVDDVLWDVAKNLIGRLGFVDCIMYLWNEDKTTMIQKAGYGVKGSIEIMNKLYFDVLPGQGVVGYVMQTKEPVLIPDTSKDSRYRPDEMIRLSEITVPVIYNNELIGVIDSEHHEKNFFTRQHLQILTTIATLMANKIRSIEAEQSLQQTRIEMYSMNEQLATAKLEALRSQMNPHFIFNCLNAIDNLMQTNQADKATTYLTRFARLIHSVLENSKSNVVSFHKDLETLQIYLQLEQFRAGNKFSYELKAEEELIYGDYKVPPLIVQPFVENAIQHGLLNKESGDRKLLINASLQGDFIQYTICDNGVGRAKGSEIKKRNRPEHKSYGIQITTERLQLHNRNGIENDILITDLFEEGLPNGTKIEVRIKIDQ
jgi:ligand-binding sensor domain-containing protein